MTNMELGEPFRRDAMKKPVAVAGISKEENIIELNSIKNCKNELKKLIHSIQLISIQFENIFYFR